ncbi:MAG: hypothetical protein ACI9DG_000841, partial [Oleispira sp.]
MLNYGGTFYQRVQFVTNDIDTIDLDTNMSYLWI